MDKANALHRYKNALFAHSLAIEAMQTLTRQDDGATVSQMDLDERAAWQRAATARKEIKEAILESIGR